MKRRPEFLRAAKGRRSVEPGVIVQTRERGPGESDLEAAHVGFTASRKVGAAVARNRARRRLRAAAARLLGAHAAPGRDYVLIARQGTLTRPFSDLLADLERALRRLGAYRNGASERTGA